MIFDEEENGKLSVDLEIMTYVIHTLVVHLFVNKSFLFSSPVFQLENQKRNQTNKKKFIKIMKEINRQEFKITITKEYQIQINDGKEYNPSIQFDGNEIHFFGNEDSIDFMKEWMEHPEKFKEYTIKYQGKEYAVIAEVLFALIVNEIKQKKERNEIFTSTEIKVDDNLKKNKQFINRLKVSLESIGMKGIEYDDVEYDYEKQGDLFQEILEKKYKFE